MPSPVPLSRVLPVDPSRFSPGCGSCSSPLVTQSTGSWLQVPVQRQPGPASRRPWSSVIYWKQLRSVVPVGSGGFGSVYRAEYLGRTVALKKVKKVTKNRLASWQSFWAELNAAHLRHPNIVRVIAATTCVPVAHGEESSLGAVLMDFVGERSLHHVVYGGWETLREARRLRFSAHMARGLAFLHAHRIVHLDLKPANVLVSAEDVCKLADFGSSLKLGGDEERTLGLGHVGGTYTHRAPELLRGLSVSPKADVYSLGITLWQLTTRDPPYSGDRQHVLYAVVAHELRPALDQHPDFRSERGVQWSRLLRRCWTGEARDRPGVTEVLEVVEQLMESVDEDGLEPGSGAPCGPLEHGPRPGSVSGASCGPQR
ncbi:proto-oncogene serine/threonine-protein kinase mos [Gouania willdenowi]|uniref:non-specific serine/threonine protein kinase n=1 Tax=Gouania willdenowi TaxID=441366 RepID=A0A8C5HHE4_GOUWI|nr:proto-oncogene serine/threonine-protein kinase mos [Gouania willdenowi]